MDPRSKKMSLSSRVRTITIEPLELYRPSYTPPKRQSSPCPTASPSPQSWPSGSRCASPSPPFLRPSPSIDNANSNRPARADWCHRLRRRSSTRPVPWLLLSRSLPASFSTPLTFSSRTTTRLPARTSCARLPTHMSPPTARSRPPRRAVSWNPTSKQWSGRQKCTASAILRILQREAVVDLALLELAVPAQHPKGVWMTLC